MAKWDEYGLKTGTSAKDEVLILDSDTNTNKRITVGDIQEFANGKMLEKENTTLNTEAKTLIGAINEVDAKNDAQDEKISTLESDIREAGTKNTEQDERIGAVEELADKKITKFYASSQGNTNLPDSDKGKIQDMFLYGKSEQAQYKGYNKLTLRDAQQTNAGIECKFVDSKLQFKGTATSTYCTFDAKEVVISAGKKITAYTDSKHGFFIWLRDSDNKLYVFNEGTKTATYDKDVTLKQFGIRGYQSGESINEIVDFGLMVGSDDYEPYVGGISSPNPDYPQEIKAVVNPKVVVRGRNLIDNLNLEQGGLNPINVKTDATQRIRFKNPIEVIGGETYTVTPYKFKNFIGVRCGIHVLTTKGEGIVDTGWIQLKFGEPMTYTMPENAAFCSIVFSFSETSENVTTYETEYGGVLSEKDIQDFKAQFEIGIANEGTIYEPYTEQTVTLPYILYAIPVSTGGNVTIGGQQYVADYVDVERGKLVRNIGSVTVTKDSITKETTSLSKDDIYIVKTDIEILGINNGGALMSNKLIERISANYPDGSFAICPPVNNGKAFRISIPNSIEVDTIHSYRIEAIGILAKSEEIDLAPEQIQAYKSLSTNYPVTNIEVSSEQLDGYTIFNYPISMAEGWNYVKQQLNDNRDYIYDMDLQSAEAYVNSEYAVALAELEVM